MFGIFCLYSTLWYIYAHLWFTFLQPDEGFIPETSLLHVVLPSGVLSNMDANKFFVMDHACIVALTPFFLINFAHTIGGTWTQMQASYQRECRLIPVQDLCLQQSSLAACKQSLAPAVTHCTYCHHHWHQLTALTWRGIEEELYILFLELFFLNNSFRGLPLYNIDGVFTGLMMYLTDLQNTVPWRSTVSPLAFL